MRDMTVPAEKFKCYSYIISLFTKYFKHSFLSFYVFFKIFFTILMVPKKISGITFTSYKMTEKKGIHTVVTISVHE